MAWLVRQVWHAFVDAGSLDGFELMDLIQKSGLATWTPATAEQAKAAEGDVVEGDPVLQLTPAARAAISTPGVRKIADV